MPYIKTETSVAISGEKEKIIKEKLGKAIECFPGKTESWLMLSFEDNSRMWFKGDASLPAAMIEVKIFGTADKIYFDRMTKTVCDIIGDELSIPKDRIYVKYETSTLWGWNGENF